MPPHTWYLSQLSCTCHLWNFGDALFFKKKLQKHYLVKKSFKFWSGWISHVQRVDGNILKIIFLCFVWNLGVLIWIVDVPEERGRDFSDKDEIFPQNLRRGEPRMQREKRKLKVKQKRREEKMEKEINMVYLHIGKYHIMYRTWLILEQVIAYTSNVRHSCLNPPSTSWKTPAWRKTCMFLGKRASTPCESCWYFSIQLIFIIRRTPIQCDGTHSII